MSKYGQIILFTEYRSILCRGETWHLKIWVEKYSHLASLGTNNSNTGQEFGDTEEDTTSLT